VSVPLQLRTSAAAVVTNVLPLHDGVQLQPLPCAVTRVSQSAHERPADANEPVVGYVTRRAARVLEQKK